MDFERTCTVSKETFKELREVRGTRHPLWESLWIYFLECQQLNRTQIKCILFVAQLIACLCITTS